MTGNNVIHVRTAAAADAPALKALWHTVFGDDPADIDDFFSIYFSPALTTVIDSGGVPVSAAYVLPVGDLIVPGHPPMPCGMIYAIATHPDCRARGYGEAVTRAAGELAVRAGFPAAVLKPADDRLFEFYEKRSDFREFFSICTLEMTAAQKAGPAPGLSAAPVRPEVYRTLRRRCLDGAVYIDMDERALGYQQALSAETGGGLYGLFDGGLEIGCAAVEREESSVLIKELLLTDGDRLEDALAALAALFPAERYHIRTTQCHKRADGVKRRFGMMLPAAGLSTGVSLQSVKWYGLAFD